MVSFGELITNNFKAILQIDLRLFKNVLFIALFCFALLMEQGYKQMVKEYNSKNTKIKSSANSYIRCL